MYGVISILTVTVYQFIIMFLIVIFLSGGATVWPFIGVSVFPEKGDGIYWHNLLRRNELDVHLTHKACPVILGTKWICNKWIGYSSQWNIEKHKCALTENARYSQHTHDVIY